MNKQEKIMWYEWAGLVGCCVFLSLLLWAAIFGYETYAKDAPVIEETVEEPGYLFVDRIEEVGVAGYGMLRLDEAGMPLLKASTGPEIAQNTSDIPEVELHTYYKIPLSEELQDHIFELCEARGVDPKIILAVISKESSYRPGVVGDNGDSLGLMQVQPKWHQGRMDRLGCQDMFDPFQNVTVGIEIVSDHIDKGRGITWALMAYNGGASYANKMTAAGKVSYYANEVLRRADALEAYTVEKAVE